MQLETVRAQGLAHNSYFLSDHGEAIVIDPVEIVKYIRS
jgi:flavorubredoxin